MTIVREFHEAFDLSRSDSPRLLSPAEAQLRLKLIREEFDEVKKELDTLIAMARQGWDREAQYDVLRKLLKELADLRYVVDGTAVAYGLDIEAASRIVHDSNMSKLGADGLPIYREDGKVLKGPNYYEADLASLVPSSIEGSADE